MKRILLIIGFFVLISNNVLYAQLEIKGEMRPRFEVLHGVVQLFPDGAEASAFVSQRTRLKTKYQLDGFTFYLSLQDVRVWGEVPQVNSADNDSFSIHEAWAIVPLAKNLNIKLGRQEFVLDNRRLFGDAPWQQQSRRHDLASVNLDSGNWNVKVAAAYNQDDVTLSGNVLTVQNNYKALQLLWANYQKENFSGSFLFLNNGLQANPVLGDSETRYSQTMGTYLKYKTGDWRFSGSAYGQFGEDVNENDLSAYQAMFELGYQVSNSWNANLGIEWLSGNDGGAPSGGDNEAFTPFYGSNHGHNGFMDYFYTGGVHKDNVGLVDLYLTNRFDLKNESNFYISAHHFSAAADIAPNVDKFLGVEVDLTYNRPLNKWANLQLGYAHMFAGEGLENLQGNFDGRTNFTGWVMLSLDPTLFVSK